jgi:alkylation response protein AidB-like acyl-CoA dehydrogenase
MSFRDIDIIPDEASRAILKELEKFTTAVMRPAGLELDACSVPADVFAGTSPLWDVFVAFRSLDLHLVNIPETLGGSGVLDAVTAALAAERLGFADAGLAFGLTAASAPFRLASRINTPAMTDLARRFCEDREGAMIGCRSLLPWPFWAQDVKTPAQTTPDGMLSARADGDGFLLSGQLSGVVNAAIATHGAFDVDIIAGDRQRTRGLAIIALDDPGIRRETASAVSSQRSLPRGGVKFSNVRIPGENVFTEKTAPAADISRSVVIEQNCFLAAVYTGLARAGLAEALAYARKRVQGGVPIFEHRNIRLQLFNMFKMVEAARACVLRLAACHDRQGTAQTWPHTVAARCLAVDTACHVTSEAIQIFGGYGLAREFPLEKFFRDARLGPVENGINEDLAIDAMRLV